MSRTWPEVFQERLYVVAWEGADEEDEVWTVSPWPDEPGWETDTACPGYGLPKEVAEAIVSAWNDRCAVFDEGKAAGEAIARSEIQRLEALVQMLSTELAQARGKRSD